MPVALSRIEHSLPGGNHHGLSRWFYPQRYQRTHVMPCITNAQILKQTCSMLGDRSSSSSNNFRQPAERGPPLPENKHYRWAEWTKHLHDVNLSGPQQQDSKEQLESKPAGTYFLVLDWQGTGKIIGGLRFPQWATVHGWFIVSHHRESWACQKECQSPEVGLAVPFKAHLRCLKS